MTNESDEIISEADEKSIDADLKGEENRQDTKEEVIEKIEDAAEVAETIEEEIEEKLDNEEKITEKESEKWEKELQTQLMIINEIQTDNKRLIKSQAAMIEALAQLTNEVKTIAQASTHSRPQEMNPQTQTSSEKESREPQAPQGSSKRDRKRWI